MEGSVPGAPEWFEFGRSLLVRRATQLAAATRSDVLPAKDRKALDARVDAARTAFAESLEHPTAFATLVANARLDAGAAEVLALLAAAESDASCHRLVAEIQADAGRNRLTLGTIAQLFGPEHPGPLAVAHDAPLRRSALVAVTAEGPWADHPVAVHAGVIWALIGDGSPDPDLPIDAVDVDVDVDSSDGSAPAADLVVVNGPDRMRRRQAGARRALGQRFVCASAPEQDSGWEALVREATITGRGVIVEVGDSLPSSGRRWMDRARHLVWVVSAVSGPAVDELPERPWVDEYAGGTEPTDEEWVAAFGTLDRTHRLTVDQLHRVSRIQSARAGDLDSAVRRLASGRLEQMTRRIRPTRGWDDIVLSPERLELLQAVVDRYLHSNQVYEEWGFAATPSRGLVALFSGPSGTGKTLAAEIIAGELGLDVFKLDLSSVVSKYIGETEKNLEQVFDAASAGNMVLFFDEADSLFGKRSEVKDARDRYANIEVSYLLQRLEAYDGLVIMATNFEKNVDEAFLRRIHTRVPFALPGEEERAAIWRHNLPGTAPTGDIDVEWLAAQFELSGGSIRNAAIQAAFVAAAAGSKVTMECAVIGVAREFRKSGRLVKPELFGDYYDVVAEASAAGGS